jgi:hypothetical protein
MGEGPCAEGAGLRGINALMLDFFDDPTFVSDLFALAVENALRFARAQVEAGADLIGVGDAAASLVGPAIYEEFIWPFEKRLVDGLHALGTRVRLHICGNVRSILEGIGRLGCDLVDLDSMVPLDQARAKIGPQTFLLGNLDPVRLLRGGTPGTIRDALAHCHRQAGSRYIIGAPRERATPRLQRPRFARIRHRSQVSGLLSRTCNSAIADEEVRSPALRASSSGSLRRSQQHRRERAPSAPIKYARSARGWARRSCRPCRTSWPVAAGGGQRARPRSSNPRFSGSAPSDPFGPKCPFPMWMVR